MEHVMAAAQKSEPVDPNVAPGQGGANEGGEGGGEVTTLDGMFERPIVVDEVIETPLVNDDPDGGWWIVRLNTDIEHMSVGTIENSFSFEQGRRYKVPQEVMSILAHRDYLLEFPQRVS
jgi:hypothetical protein